MFRRLPLPSVAGMSSSSSRLLRTTPTAVLLLSSSCCSPAFTTSFAHASTKPSKGNSSKLSSSRKNSKSSVKPASPKNAKKKQQEKVSSSAIEGEEDEDEGDTVALKSRDGKMIMRPEQDEEAEYDFDDDDDGKPSTLLVQLCDHMRHDQGVKRHAVTITFGADGFELANLCRDVRRDLKGQLASSYWQMNQTQERSAFFVCTRINHGTADLLITSMTQNILNYVEGNFGYQLKSSYVTLSPDVQHTSVRMLYHYFIFSRKGRADDESMSTTNNNSGRATAALRRHKNKSTTTAGVVREFNDDDGEDEEDEEDDGDEAFQQGRPEFRNFEPPQVGPQEMSKPPKRVPREQAVVKRIWSDDE